MGWVTPLRYLLIILEKQKFRIAIEERHTLQPNLGVQVRQFKKTHPFGSFESETWRSSIYKKMENCTACAKIKRNHYFRC